MTRNPQASQQLNAFRATGLGDLTSFLYSLVYFDALLSFYYFSSASLTSFPHVKDLFRISSLLLLPFGDAVHGC